MRLTATVWILNRGYGVSERRLLDVKDMHEDFYTSEAEAHDADAARLENEAQRAREDASRKAEQARVARRKAAELREVRVRVANPDEVAEVAASAAAAAVRLETA